MVIASVERRTVSDESILLASLGIAEMVVKRATSGDGLPTNGEMGPNFATTGQRNRIYSYFHVVIIVSFEPSVG